MGEQHCKKGKSSKKGGEKGGRRAANNNNNKKPESKKTLEDCTCHVGSSRQAGDHITVTNCIVNHIRQERNSRNFPRPSPLKFDFEA